MERDRSLHWTLQFMLMLSRYSYSRRGSAVIHAGLAHAYILYGEECMDGVKITTSSPFVQHEMIYCTVRLGTPFKHC